MMAVDLLTLALNELGRLADEKDPARFVEIEPALNKVMKTSGGKFHPASQRAYKALRHAAANNEKQIPACCEQLVEQLKADYPTPGRKTVAAGTK